MPWTALSDQQISAFGAHNFSVTKASQYRTLALWFFGLIFRYKTLFNTFESNVGHKLRSQFSERIAETMTSKTA